MKLGLRIGLTAAFAVAALVVTFGVLRIESIDRRVSQDMRRETERLAYAVHAYAESDLLRALDSVGPLEEAFSTDGVVVRIYDGRDEQTRSDALEGSQTRLKRLLTGGEDHIFEQQASRVILALPLHVSYPSTGLKQVVGSIEVLRDFSPEVAQARREVRGLITGLAVVLVLSTLVIVVLVGSQVLRPLRKLIAGIDAVATGDLSQAVLQERDDEIGQLADRFNAMTQSLRASQATAKSESEGKLALEQRLRHSETLATVGQLAAEIAHEVGTPLNVISARAKGIEKKVDKPDAVKRNASIIAEQTSRITRIIERLLDLTRRRVGGQAKEHADVREVLRKGLELLEGQLNGAGITLSIEDNIGDHSEAAIPEDQLYQIVLNVLVNAIHALPNGGTVNAKLGVETLQRPNLESDAASDYLTLRLADSGPGVPEDLRKRIFEPFFTTKGESGNGLGLAVAAAILRDHDGWIEVDESSLGGAEFLVCLVPTSHQGSD